MERGEVWFVAITTAVIGFIFGMAWSGISPNGRWLYDYQPLVTGALAVAAAFITVNVMSRTEESQQKRHSELYELTLRPARLAVQRAAHMEGFYRRLASDVADLNAAFRARLEVNKSFLNEGEVKRFLDISERIARGCDMRPIKSAVELFGPQMTAQYETMVRTSTKISASFNDIANMPNWTTITQDAEQKALKAAFRFLDLIEFQHPTLNRFADSLLALRTEYENAHRSSSP